MPKKNHKSLEIKKVISRMFAQNGYHSTSIRDIAQELGVNQASIYYYFRNKEDMLFSLMDEAMDEALNKLEKICTIEQTSHAKLQKILRFYIGYYAGDQDRETLLINEINSLSEEPKNILIQKQRQYVNLIRSLLIEMQDQKIIKKINPTVATFAFFGMVHYLVKWYNPNGAIGVNELTDIFVEIFTKGILIDKDFF